MPTTSAYRERRTSCRTAAWLGAVSAMAVACGGTATGDGADAGAADATVSTPDAAPPVDLSEELFRPDHVLEISITLAPADWAALRVEPDRIGMPKLTCGNRPLEKPYTYFPGDITVDGVTVTNVGVRKKGGFGSISDLRPGLKIKASEYALGQRISGLKRLTLNNNSQDRTFISQCLGYDLFRSAGLPASRCSFAHVTVNGEDLGIYSNVESIKKNFLRRHFADDTGRLYESGGEFIGGAVNGFQPKTNKQAPDCSDLGPVVTALQTPDAQFPAALGAVVDTDSFLTYWGMEVLTDHWDGFANNQNNYFFYHDPTSDKFHFIPWGIDALFTGRLRTTRPKSVYACGSIPWRMYDVAETKAAYLAKLRQLVATVWDKPALLTEITRMQTLIEPFFDAAGRSKLADALQGTRTFVRTRGEDLLAELDAGTPVWPYVAGEESCRINIGSVTGTFNTTWDTLSNYSTGSATTTGTISGIDLASSSGFSNAGMNAESRVQIQLFTNLPDGRLAVVFMTINDPANLAPGTMAVDLVNVAGFMTFYDPDTDTASGGGLILGGTLTLTSTGTNPGDPIVGSITGDVFEL